MQKLLEDVITRVNYKFGNGDSFVQSSSHTELPHPVIQAEFLSDAADSNSIRKCKSLVREVMWPARPERSCRRIFWTR